MIWVYMHNTTSFFVILSTGKQCTPRSTKPCLSGSKGLNLDYCYLCLPPYNTINCGDIGLQNEEGWDRNSQWCQIHRSDHLYHHYHCDCYDCLCGTAEQLPQCWWSSVWWSPLHLYNHSANDSVHTKGK